MTVIDLTPQVIIDSGEYYYVENLNESIPLRFQWDKRKYVVASGEKKLVPFDIIALWFGDPRSKVGVIQNFHDSTGPGQVPERIAEVKRLCVRYGVYEQGMDDIKEAMLQENRRLADVQKNTIQRILPLKMEMLNVRVYAISGAEIICPLFDHQGIHQYGFNLDEEKSDDIVTIIDRMQRQIDDLKERQVVLDENGDNDEEGITYDNPGIPDTGQGLIVAS